MSVVIVSWILVLLSGVTLSMSHDVRTEARLVDLDADALVSRCLARSGVATVEAMLWRTGRNDWDAPIEGWDCNPSLKMTSLGDGAFSVGYRSDVSSVSATRYGIEDEERRLPVRQLDREILSRIPGLAPSDVDTLLAYALDPQRTLLVDPEDLPGLTDPGRQLAKEYLSRTGGPGVNVNTASKPVLMALGISATTADRIVAYRDGPDALPGTPDDAPFTSVLDPTGGLSALDLDPEATASLTYLARRGLLSVRSSHFRVRSRGWIGERKQFLEIDALLFRPEGARTRIVEWGEQWNR